MAYLGQPALEAPNECPVGMRRDPTLNTCIGTPGPEHPECPPGEMWGTQDRCVPIILDEEATNGVPVCSGGGCGGGISLGMVALIVGGVWLLARR